VSSLEDVEVFLPHEAAGIAGVISGRAIYDGRIDLAAALARLRDAA
jgi:phosphoribosylformimino-5-aminoimidazole carboxamide ribotide isomerase